MSKLFTELQRLYCLQGQKFHTPQSDGDENDILTPEIAAQTMAGEINVALDIVSTDGMARAMVVEFTRAGDWAQVGKLYQALQNDLDFPAPAVAVTGDTGYRLWVSLTEPIPVAQACSFLNLLRSKYLAEMTDASLVLCPGIEKYSRARPGEIYLAPALNMTTGKWSAFIDPSMVSMFVDGPWLEMAPSMDKQAGILARLQSITPVEFDRALIALQTQAEIEARPDVAAGEKTSGLPDEDCRSALDVGKAYSDPQSFLLAVMNDPSLSAHQRIKAAKALLPYFNKLG